MRIKSSKLKVTWAIKCYQIISYIYWIAKVSQTTNIFWTQFSVMSGRYCRMIIPFKHLLSTTFLQGFLLKFYWSDFQNKKFLTLMWTMFQPSREQLRSKLLMNASSKSQNLCFIFKAKLGQAQSWWQKAARPLKLNGQIYKLKCLFSNVNLTLLYNTIRWHLLYY